MAAVFTAFGNLVDRVNTLETNQPPAPLDDPYDAVIQGPTTVEDAFIEAQLDRIALIDTNGGDAVTSYPIGVSVTTANLRQGQILRFFHTGPTTSGYNVITITFTNSTTQVFTIYPQEAYSLVYISYTSNFLIIPGIINAGNITPI